MSSSQAETDDSFSDFAMFLSRQGVYVSGRDNLVRLFGQHRDAYSEMLRADEFTEEEISQTVAIFENARQPSTSTRELGREVHPLVHDDILKIVNECLSANKYCLASLFLFSYGFQQGGNPCTRIKWKNIFANDLQDGNLQVTVTVPSSRLKTGQVEGPRNINSALLSQYTWQELFVFALNKHFIATAMQQTDITNLHNLSDLLNQKVWLQSSMTYQNKLVHIWGKIDRPGSLKVTFGSLQEGGIRDGTLTRPV